MRLTIDAKSVLFVTVGFEFLIITGYIEMSSMTIFLSRRTNFICFENFHPISNAVYVYQPSLKVTASIMVLSSESGFESCCPLLKSPVAYDTSSESYGYAS